MDLSKTGKLFYDLRTEKGYTQKEIADKLNISAKAVSKWETGRGFPDISLICELSEIFGVDIRKLLEGEIAENKPEVGNMKKTKFYVCEKCGNILIGVGDAQITCCGRNLVPLVAKQCDDSHRLNIETVENEYYITFSHQMEKEHYISFVACVRFDRVLIVRLYPEQGGELRIPNMRKSKLYFYCNKHGLFEFEE